MVYKSYNSIFLKNKNLFLYSTISLVAENAKKKKKSKHIRKHIHIDTIANQFWWSEYFSAKHSIALIFFPLAFSN